MSSSSSELRLDHVGVQVRALEPAVAQFTALFGYRQATEPVTNTRHAVRVVFLEKEGSVPLKLICPLDEKARSVTRLHHLAFRTDHLDEAAQHLCEQGGACSARQLRAKPSMTSRSRSCLLQG